MTLKYVKKIKGSVDKNSAKHGPCKRSLGTFNALFILGSFSYTLRKRLLRDEWRENWIGSNGKFHVTRHVKVLTYRVAKPP